MLRFDAKAPKLATLESLYRAGVPFPVVGIRARLTQRGRFYSALFIGDDDEQLNADAADDATTADGGK